MAGCLINIWLIKYIFCLSLLLFLIPQISYAFDWQIDGITQVGRLALRYDVDPNLLLAVVSCESNFNPHAINHNKNGTTDYNLGQINSIHIPFFKRMGLDVVHDPIDNLEATAYLLSHHGTSDYMASEYCWSQKINNYEMFDAVGSSSLPTFLAIQ